MNILWLKILRIASFRLLELWSSMGKKMNEVKIFSEVKNYDTRVELGIKRWLRIFVNNWYLLQQDQHNSLKKFYPIGVWRCSSLIIEKFSYTFSRIFKFSRNCWLQQLKSDKSCFCDGMHNLTVFIRNLIHIILQCSSGELLNNSYLDRWFSVRGRKMGIRSTCLQTQKRDKLIYNKIKTTPTMVVFRRRYPPGLICETICWSSGYGSLAWRRAQVT